MTLRLIICNIIGNLDYNLYYIVVFYTDTHLNGTRVDSVPRTGNTSDWEASI